MFWTVLALVMTVIMGGIIAYYGDLIGRKFGKKRLSMFGLRPKYTAILITTVSGVAISAITVIVLFLLVPPVRDIILDGEAAIRDIKPMQSKLAAGKTELATTKQEIIRFKQESVTAAENLKTAHEQLKSLESRLDQLDRQLTDGRKQLRDAQTERDKARSLEAQARGRYTQLVAKNTELGKSNGKLASANQALSGKNKDLVAINEALAKEALRLTRESIDLTKKNAEYTRQNEEVARQNESVLRENSRLTRLQNDLLEKRSQIAQRTKDLSDYNAQLDDRNRSLADSNKKLAQQNSDLNEIFKQITPGYKSLRDAYNASRSKRIAIHRDEDLARLVVPARSSPEDVRRTVQDLLHDASQVAAARGAVTGGQARTVQVVDHQYVTRSDIGADETLAVTGDDRIDALVRRLAWLSTPTCVLAVAVANSVEDEPAAIDLVPLTNKAVYSKGQEIAAHSIDAGLSVEHLFDDVVAFLRNMGQHALQQGMIPRTDSAGDPQVGSLTAAEIAKLVERVREFNGYVRIRAIAASNINAADPLLLTFKVEP